MATFPLSYPQSMIRWTMIGVLVAFLIAFYNSEFRSVLDLNFIKSSQSELQEMFVRFPFAFSLGYMGGYVIATALSLPVAALLTLLGGAVFGLPVGVLLVSISSSVGATLAFLLSRYLLREWLALKFPTKIQLIDEGVRRDGPYYLLSLRLIPIFPFFLVNFLMGFTPMKAIPFLIFTQLGMLPGIIATVNIGKELSQVQSLTDVFSFPLLLSLTALGLIPIVAKRFFRKG